MLTGKEIARCVSLGFIRIEPFNPKQCQPTSYDFRLGNILRILKCNSKFKGRECIHPRKPQKSIEIRIPKSGYLLEAGECYLGRTMEKFGSNCYSGEITGKSSTGRIFLAIHKTASHVDPGFFGNLTLEITAGKPTLILPGMLIGQICFFESVGELELYKGKYQNSEGAEPSLVHRDFHK